MYSLILCDRDKECLHILPYGYELPHLILLIDHNTGPIAQVVEHLFLVREVACSIPDCTISKALKWYQWIPVQMLSIIRQATAKDCTTNIASLTKKKVLIVCIHRRIPPKMQPFTYPLNLMFKHHTSTIYLFVWVEALCPDEHFFIHVWTFSWVEPMLRLSVLIYYRPNPAPLVRFEPATLRSRVRGFPRYRCSQNRS